MSTFNANRVNGLSNAMSNYMENKKAEDDAFDSDEFVVKLVKSGYFENIFPMLVPMSLVKIIMAHANDTIPYFAYLPLLGNVAKDYDPNTGIWNEYDDLEHLWWLLIRIFLPKILVLYHLLSCMDTIISAFQGRFRNLMA